MIALVFYIIFLSAPGVVCNTWCLMDQLKNLEAVRGTGEEYTVAMAGLRSEAVRLFVQLYFFALAILWLYLLTLYPEIQPVTTPRQQAYEVWKGMVGMGFVLVSITLMLSSVMNVVERRRLLSHALKGESYADKGSC